MNDVVTAATHVAQPIFFSESLETVAPDEMHVQAELSATLRQISETTLHHSGHASRSVHAKSHGLLRGQMTVPTGLPAALAQGMFATPGTYDVMMRFSTLPGDILDDEISTPRGLAIKVIGVEGPRLPGSEGQVTQDFVLVNGPAFAAPDAKAFLASLKMLAATTDKGPTLKKLGSRLARGIEAVLEAFGTKSPLVVTLGGQPATHILGETFYSQAPLRHGDHVAKLAVVPVSPALRRLTGAAVAVTGRPNALRDAVLEHFAAVGGEWEVRVQLCTDLHTMPIEDASVIWPEAQSPYIAVATLAAPRQDSWSVANVAEIDEGAAFSPWHGLAAHRPLGSVMRARRNTYADSANFRAASNGCPIHEPTSLAGPGHRR